jgi:glycerol-3-phosphate dehydrogenase
MSEIIDVIIVGAGVNGCAIARQLSLEGKRVVLLECNEIAFNPSP